MDSSSNVIVVPPRPLAVRLPPKSDRAGARRLAAVALLALTAAIVLEGQFSTDLATMDDFREAEVAREMWRVGDYVVPHLAGLPFVEKPPGFPLLLTLAYRLAGGPSVPAARLLTAAIALLTLSATYRLGRRAGGSVAGVAAALALALAPGFSRVAHTILLDNALVASLAWAHVCFLGAQEDPHPRGKRLRYAAASFLVGVSFLFKGFVGPAIFAAGALTHVVVTRSWREAAAALHPLSLAAFLAPVLAWVVPFVATAPPDLWYEFFVANHLGRAVHGYQSHPRPIYFYAVTLVAKFAPAVLLLPFAGASAWKRRAPCEMYFLCGALGGFALLSAASAKDTPYLLPVYPLLAALVGTFVARRLTADEGRLRPAVALGGAAALACLSALVAAGIGLGGAGPAAVLGTMASVVGAASLLRSLRRNDSRAGAWTVGALAACCALTFYSAPVWDGYLDRQTSRPMLKAVLDAAGDSDLFLYQPDDQTRGALGFYRDRTAQEIGSADGLMGRLKLNPGSLAVIVDAGPSGQEVLDDAARRSGLRLDRRYQTSLRNGAILVLAGAETPD
jgi:4-amino-4-deoxy-L-arabinose transferase-like glycosyltransferase